jgi:hypothetical protein
MTIPDKPRSSKQKYRLTDKSRQVVAQNGGGQLATDSLKDL